jgi:DNA-binding NarL/FixJ family response regulator
MKTIRVLLADDHTIVRAGIRSLLEKMERVEVVGEAGDGREALKMVKTTRPNIVLMDIAMPSLNGLDATMRLRKEFPEVRVIILSMYANEEYVAQALKAGASGYMLKDAATAELEIALQAVARGDTYLSPVISKRVIDDYVGRGSGQTGAPEQLTPRQREILQLIAEGKRTKEVAYLLNVSVKTVETHRAQLMERLGIHDVPGLVRYAMRMRLIPPEM